MSKIKLIIWAIIRAIPITRPFYETRNTQTPLTFKMWFFQKILGFNKEAYWQTHFTSTVSGVQNIYAGIDTSPGFSHGCYIQGGGKIYVGDYTQIAPNVGIISANHDVYNSKISLRGEVYIGKYCWIGMNALILPNVKLGDFTIVGAGAVVTKSFEEGFCIIGGNPAKIIKYLDKEKCIPFKNEFEYNGYIKSEKFDDFRKKNLKI